MSLIGTSTLPAFVPLREMLSFPPLHFYIHMSVNRVLTIDSLPFKCHLSCQLVGEMKGMTLLLSKRFYSNSSCDIIVVQCLWPNDMQQFYHILYFEVYSISPSSSSPSKSSSSIVASWYCWYSLTLTVTCNKFDKYM